jgi:hypothetical protein
MTWTDEIVFAFIGYCVGAGVMVSIELVGKLLAVVQG